MNESLLERIDRALTSKKWQWHFYESPDCPATLHAFFLKHLSHLAPESWGVRLSLGGFYVNGLVAFENVALTAPCKVEYYEPKFEISHIENVFPAFSKEWIIYEDEFLLAVHKPPRLPCLPTKEQKIFNLKLYLERYLQGELHMPSRLDTSTEGLVIASKNPKMHNYLQQAFERRKITKKYLLYSDRRPAWEFLCVKNFIIKDSRHPILRKVSQQKDGKPSITIFSCLRSGPAGTLIAARPLTGRTHQIRLHASHAGIPILGDNFYNGAEATRLHLLSYSLSLWHPYEKKHIDLVVPGRLLPSWV